MALASECPGLPATCRLAPFWSATRSSSKRATKKNRGADPTAHAEMLVVARGGAPLGRVAPFGRDALRDEGAMRHVRRRDRRSAHQTPRVRRQRSKGRSGRRSVRRPPLVARKPSRRGRRRRARRPRPRRNCSSFFGRNARPARREASNRPRRNKAGRRLGEVVEWLKAPASKAGERDERPESSNLSLSAMQRKARPTAGPVV